MRTIQAAGASEEDAQQQDKTGNCFFLDIARIASAGFIMANKCSSVHSPMTMQYLQATSASKDN